MITHCKFVVIVGFLAESNQYDVPNFLVVMNTTINKDKCLVFIAHIWDDITIAYTKHIKKEVEGIMDFAILYDLAHQAPSTTELSDLNAFEFCSVKFNDFFFMGERKLPNPLVALLAFANERKYEHYLLMENDIVFTRDFRDFVKNVSKVECDYMHIGTDIQESPQNHWPVNYIQKSPFSELKFSWCHILYVSRNLLSDAANFMKENNTFYYEFLLPSLAYNKGYKVFMFEELGYKFNVSWGPTPLYEQKYVCEHNSNTFYHPIKNLHLVDFLQSRKEHTLCADKKQVVLLATHIVNDFVLAKYRRMRKELNKDKYDVVMLVNKNDDENYIVPDDVNCFFTDCDLINDLLYEPIEETLLPGSCHFPVLRFFLDNKRYTHYWFVEYDVEFTGEWNVIMEDCDESLSDYDFLSCHVEKFDAEKNGNWTWWYRSNHLGLDLKTCIKGFNPICRYSCRALSYLNLFQKVGNSAHSEVLITTCLYQAGFKIGDFGGQGKFVPEGYKDKYYIPNPQECNDSTMRYRPVYNAVDISNKGLKNKLYHPIKE